MAPWNPKQEQPVTAIRYYFRQIPPYSEGSKNKRDIIFHPAVARITIHVEPGSKANQVDWQILFVGDEPITFQRDRLGVEACSDREALHDSGCRLRRGGSNSRICGGCDGGEG